MDPDALWRMLPETFERTEQDTNAWEETEEHAENLLQWLQNGGFPPDVTGRPRFDRIVAATVCEALLDREE